MKHVVVGGIAAAVGATALLAPNGANGAAAAAVWSAHAPLAPTEDLTRAFVEIRVAEVAGDVAALGTTPSAIDGTASDLLRARIELARDSIARRAKARTAREVAAAESEIGRSRAALATRIAGLGNGASKQAARDSMERSARELLLECVEDAILRRLAADATEAALAIAWPSAEMRASAREALAEIDGWLSSPLLASALAPDGPIETDTVVFRAHMLGGLARLVESDLGRADGGSAAAGAADLRREASRLLERAAQTELRIPKPLAELLDLGRARATDDDALRSRLLATAAQGTDPTTAFVARVLDWRSAGADRPFPDVGTNESETLRLLAATAEAHARAERGDPMREAARPLERFLAAASVNPADADGAGGSATLGRAARLLSVRLSPAVRSLAEKSTPPPVLVALVAIADGRCDVPAGSADAARAATEDGLLAPWFNVPYASAILRAKPPRTAEAVAMLEWLLVHVPADPQARAAIGIIIEIRRAESTRAAAGEVALDRALALAIRSFPEDPSRDGWILERIDLALEPRQGARSPDRARELVATLSEDHATKAPREARAIEVELTALEPAADAAPDPEARRTAEALARRAADAARAADATDRASIARLAASEAEALGLAGRHAEARTRAEAAIGARTIDRIAAVRGARAWTFATLALDGPSGAAPAGLAAIIVDEPAAREALERPMLELSARLEKALVEGPGDRKDAVKREARAAVTIAETLLRAATGPADGESVADPVGALAAGEAVALGALLDADPERAERAAREAEGLAREADLDERRASWILGEALRAAGTTEAREEAFTIFRDLSPLAARARDRFWWRAQLGQLEILVEEPGRADDVLARVNQLEALDRSFGDRALARRFASVRERAADELARTKSSREADVTRRAAEDGDGG